MNIELSFDDGHPLDLKLAEVLDKYNLPVTFYIPSNTDMTADDIVNLNKRYEIGGHTVTHPYDMKKLSINEQRIEVVRNKVWLEGIINGKVNKFAYPRGRYNDDTVEAVKRAGYTYARTTRVSNTSTPVDMFRVNTTVHIFQRREYEGLSWFKIGRLFYHLSMQKTEGYFHLWGHSWEIERDDEWDNLKQFLDFITDYESVHSK